MALGFGWLVYITRVVNWDLDLMHQKTKRNLHQISLGFINYQVCLMTFRFHKDLRVSKNLLFRDKFCTFACVKVGLKISTTIITVYALECRCNG
jgi:hypothetical protein